MSQSFWASAYVHWCCPPARSLALSSSSSSPLLLLLLVAAAAVFPPRAPPPPPPPPSRSLGLPAPFVLFCPCTRTFVRSLARRRLSDRPTDTAHPCALQATSEPNSVRNDLGGFETHSFLPLLASYSCMSLSRARACMATILRHCHSGDDVGFGRPLLRSPDFFQTDILAVRLHRKVKRLSGKSFPDLFSSSDVTTLPRIQPTLDLLPPEKSMFSIGRWFFLRTWKWAGGSIDVAECACAIGRRASQ